MLRTALLMVCLVMTALAMRANDGAMPGQSLAAMEVQHDMKEDADGKFCDYCNKVACKIIGCEKNCPVACRR